MAIGPVAFKSAHVLVCLAIAGRAAVAGGSEVFRGCSAPVTDLSKPQTAVFLVSWLPQYQQHKDVSLSCCPWGILSPFGLVNEASREHQETSFLFQL